MVEGHPDGSQRKDNFCQMSFFRNECEMMKCIIRLLFTVDNNCVSVQRERLIMNIIICKQQDIVRASIKSQMVS